MTETDNDGDQREEALVAQAGPASQIIFDDRRGASSTEWVGHRTGLNGHDQETTINAIKTWLPDPEVGPHRKEYERVEREAHALISADEAQRLIERVAVALDAESVLDEVRLRELLR